MVKSILFISCLLLSGLQADRVTNIVDSNAELVEHFYELLDRQDEAYKYLFSKDCEIYLGSSDSPITIDAAIPFVREHYKAFPDYRHHIQFMVNSEGFVTVRVRYTGTQKEPFFGQGATGKQIDYSGIFIFKIDGGLITQVWGIEDDLLLQKQIGNVENR